MEPMRIRTGEWSDWHEEYDDPNSEIAARARGVQQLVTQVVTTFGSSHGPAAETNPGSDPAR
jgi:hypothetical protein